MRNSSASGRTARAGADWSRGLYPGVEQGGRKGVRGFQELGLELL